MREGLESVIACAGFTVESFSSAKEFLLRAELKHPCCLILDDRMPEMTGSELQQLLSDNQIQLSIIFISAFANVGKSVNAMKLGAIDYLEKPFAGEELISAVRSALDKDRSKHAYNERAARSRALFKTLTLREMEVFDHVVEGLSNKQVAAKLDISENTVKIHRGRVMRKMNVQSLPELVAMREFVHS